MIRAAKPRLRYPTSASALLLALLAAAGCAERRDTAGAQPLETLAATPANTGWTALAPGAALVRLPQPGERAVIVMERRLAEGLVQEIELPSRPGIGRNRITLGVHNGAPVAGLGPGKPSEAGIRAELATAFPDRPMRVVTQPRYNAFGLYGMAVASGPGKQRCLYAWQWLDRGDPQVAERLGGSASWRARICRNDVTLDQLAGDLDRLALGADTLDPTPAVQRRAAPAQRQAAPARSVSSLRKAPPIAVETGTTIAADGRHYLAPVGSAAPVGLLRVPAAVTESRTALDTSLPAEAYRGPVARSGPPSQLSFREASAVRVTVPAPD